MTNKIYFDTNVIVDLFDIKRVFHQESVAVLKGLFADESAELFINSDTMTNLFYILRNHVKLNFEESIEKMEFIKDSFEIVSITINEVEFALELCKDKQFDDYEDALQYVCGLKENCGMIVTNNVKDFKSSMIEIISSKDFPK